MVVDPFETVAAEEVALLRFSLSAVTFGPRRPGGAEIPGSALLKSLHRKPLPACSRKRSWSRTYSAIISIEACRLCSFILNRLAFVVPPRSGTPLSGNGREQLARVAGPGRGCLDDQGDPLRAHRLVGEQALRGQLAVPQARTPCRQGASGTQRPSRAWPGAAGDPLLRTRRRTAASPIDRRGASHRPTRGRHRPRRGHGHPARGPANTARAKSAARAARLHDR